MKTNKKFKNPKILAFSLMVLFLILGSVIYVVADRNNNQQSNDLVVQSNDAPIQPANKEPATDPEESLPNEEKPVSQPTIKNTPQPSKWPVLLSKSEASSLEVVVNKKYKLPSNYVPNLTSAGGGQLRPEAATAYNKLLAGAKSVGINLVFLSGYRSYSYQSTLYNNYVARDGQAAADTYSARPGHSEHQTGLTVDVGDGGGCDLEDCFGDRAAGKWVAANAHKYGFVLRYPKSKESITGYTYEPWHLRYIGENTAASVYSSGKVLEEYYGVEGGGY